jgi:hypothetical protein
MLMKLISQMFMLLMKTTQLQRLTLSLLKDFIFFSNQEIIILKIQSKLIMLIQLLWVWV